MTKQIHLAAHFPGVNNTTVWSDPAAGSHIEFSSFVKLAQTAERAKFDFFFLAEGLRLREQGGKIYDLDVVGRPDTFTVLAVLGAAAALAVLFRGTGIGLQMRASAFDALAARLQGVRVTRMYTLGWALAALTGSLAGVLVAPAVFVGPNTFDAILVFAFTAAVLGGLDSPVGAIIGGLVLGLSLSYVSGYAGSSLVTLAALAILIAVLMVRPEGLFSVTRARRI